MTFNANDQTTLSGLFKRVYADNEKDVLVYDDTFARLAPFQEADRQGDVWCLPLVLGMEQGYHAASDGSLFAVTASVPSEVKQAQVNATQSQMNTRVSLATVYRSLSKEAAFKPTLDFLIAKNAKSHAVHQEWDAIYGQVGIGRTSEVAASGTTVTFTFLETEWAPSLWLVARGLRVDVFATLASASPTNANGYIEIRTVNLATRQVTGVCAAADAAALDALTTAVIFRTGNKVNATTYKEAPGLIAVANNTGIMHNIDAAQYALWRSTVKTSYGAITTAKSFQDVADSVSAGLDNGVDVITAPTRWSALMSSLMTNRQFDFSYRPQMAETGAKEVMATSMTGQIDYHFSKYMPNGYMFVMAKGSFYRVGSTPITFNIPMISDYIYPLQDGSGLQFASFKDQAFFMSAPAQFVMATGVTTS